ncbi:CAAX prenyl protease 2-like [Oscarella lobularis]|uniref:CAAX prenyl protease 2-like n=1 Tax=Oscarella lobularis TaxID=121494 RepID=UPI0033136CA8
MDFTAPVVYSKLSLSSSLFLCFVLALLFVGSLYIWHSPHPRNHPETIKKRFAGILVSIVASITILWAASSEDREDGFPLYWRLGIKLEGLVPAVFYPLILTMVLFLGPLVMIIADGDLYSCLENSSHKHVLWWRNFFIAPLSEEFVFRSCMLTLLVPHFGQNWSVIICPLFFGVAHLHHVREQLRLKENRPPVHVIWMNAFFQFFYTSVFGAYSARLFIRTGHLVAPFVCHSFCNFMGFPDFGRIFELPRVRGFLLAATYVAGATGFFLLLDSLTKPELFA